MKKKLIAIVTSLAMVATMVPATAFAASASPAAIAKTAALSTAYTEVKTALAEYDSADPDDATYDQYNEVVELRAKIENLNSVEEDIVKNGTTNTGDAEGATVKGYYDDFAAVEEALKTTDDAIKAAQKAIDSIENVIVADDPNVAAATTAYDAAKVLTNLGNHPTTGRSDEEEVARYYIGATRSAAYDDAVAVATVANAIDGMTDVSESNYSTYEAAIANGVIAQYNALSSSLQARVGNENVYNENVQGAKDARAAETIIRQLNTAVTATYAAPPYKQADVTAVQDLFDKAIEAIEKLPASIDTDSISIPVLWTGTNELLGTKAAKYEDSDTYTLLQTMETYVKNDAAVKPVIDAIHKLSTSMKWSEANKDAMFAATYAYDQLTSAQKGIISSAYTDENTLFTNAKANWVNQEKANKNEAKAWLEAKINAIPATVTIADKAAVKEATAAYNEYLAGGGYLNGVLTSSDISSTLAAKIDTAASQMAALEKTQLEADKKAAKAFLDLMGASGTVGTLWHKVANDSLTAADEALVKEARTAYDKLTDDQKSLTAAVAGAGYDVVAAYEALEQAEAYFAAGDTQTMANNLIVAIRALPANPTLADKDAVYAVNNDFLAAIKKNPAVKAAVTNAETLYEAVGAVMDLEIAELPILKGDGTDTQEEINNAAEKIGTVKNIYDAIGSDQQKKVTKTATLDQATAQLSKAQVAVAAEALKAAATIDPEAELTAEDIVAIRAAKEAVDALNADQQKELDADALKKLNEELLPLLETYEAEICKLENATIAAIDAVTYDGTAKTPAVTVTDKAGTVIADTEYDVRYSNNTNAGTATVIVSAKSGSAYTGSITADFTIEKADIQTAAKAGAIAKQTYNKKAKTPAVTVTAGDKKLVTGSDYTVTYANNTNIGQAKATITGTGNYKGTITTTFIIAPAKGKITSLKAGKKQFTVSYEAQKASGKTGYRIVYSPAKGKAKAVQTTATKKTIKSLKSGKTYKVKVRAYKTIDGKKYVGDYSSVKKVKVK